MSRGEFARTLQFLGVMGIRHKIEWEMEKLLEQEQVDELGLNVSRLALVAIRVGDTLLVFSKGQPYWTSYEDDMTKGHRGWGEEGMYLFTYGLKANAVVPRVKIRASGDVVEGVQGRGALEDACHAVWPDFTSRS